MDASIVDKDLIERINKGEEKAFEVLYNSYFVYLCACMGHRTKRILRIERKEYQTY